jgi:uncharacterized protein YjbI with pentapeptide repeats
LTGADLSGADMTGTDSMYAELTDSLRQDADLTNVTWNNTICPDGTNSDDNGNTCENNLLI